jgi:hypothetical protein
MNSSGWPIIDGTNSADGAGLFNNLLNEDFNNLDGWSSDDATPDTEYQLSKSVTCAFTYSATDGSVTISTPCS